MAIFGLQPAQAATKTLEGLFGPVIARGAPGSVAARQRPRFVKRNVPVCSPDVLEQNEPRDHIAVTRGRTDSDASGFFEGSADPVQRFVGQYVGRGPIAPIEVGDEPGAYLQVSLALRVDAIIQPSKESREGGPRNSRVRPIKFLRENSHVDSSLALIGSREIVECTKTCKTHDGLDQKGQINI